MRAILAAAILVALANATHASPPPSTLELLPAPTPDKNPPPRGLIVIRSGGVPTLIAWGESVDSTKRRLPGVSCMPWQGSTMCHLSDTDPWRADFGDDRRIEGAIAYGEEGMFQYVLFPSPDRDFAFLERVLTAALGPPDHAEDSEIQNRMGARFSQRELRWEVGDVAVSLDRYGGSIDKGVFTAVYLPLAPGRKPDTGRAPF